MDVLINEFDRTFHMHKKLQAAQDFFSFIAQCWSASSGNKATTIFMWIVNVAGALSLIGFTVSFPVSSIPRELSMLIFLIALLIATGWVIQGARITLCKAGTDAANLRAAVEQQARDAAILIAEVERLKHESTRMRPARSIAPGLSMTGNSFTENGTAVLVSDDSTARIEAHDNDFTGNDRGIDFRTADRQ